ncbi:MAG: hypothetical protein IRZ33_07725 [Alicyclobacillaceae bacterium]|nr:hypothetical protein [Alicyclobacillaceae bacterium]
MRQQERLQAGLALAALVLCLTTSVQSLQSWHAGRLRAPHPFAPAPAALSTSAAGVDADDPVSPAPVLLAQVIHHPLAEADALIVSRVDHVPSQPLLCVTRDQPLFVPLASLLDAAPMVAHGGRYAYRLEFLYRGTTAGRELWMTRGGELLDAKTGRYFQAGTDAVRLVERLLTTSG